MCSLDTSGLMFDGKMLKPLESTATFAKITGMTPRGLRKLCAQGRVPATKIGSEWRISTKRFLAQLGLLSD